MFEASIVEADHPSQNQQPKSGAPSGYGLLYHHGGIYMDADFIVLKDLTPVIQRLDDHDLISYATNSNAGGVCSDSFSSNFIAGRKGSIFMKKIWDKQKASERVISFPLWVWAVERRTLQLSDPRSQLCWWML